MQYPKSESDKLKISIMAMVLVGINSTVIFADNKVSVTPEVQGKRIYQEGLLGSGKPLEAKTQGNMDVTGPQLACISCHRRSGLGSYEGKVQIPPIAGRLLLVKQSAPLPRVQTPATKGYSEADVRQIIQTGIAPDGHVLNPLMPRYKFGDQDLDAIIIYLKSLSDKDSPGADAQSMHFATVVSAKVSAEKRKVMLDYMRKLFPFAAPATTKKVKQIQTPASRAALFQYRRRGRVPNYFPARKPDLKVWELKGPSSSWGRQLDSYYRKQPVFAIIGGLAEGPWEPVHEFCEHHQVPCLFPNTVEPVVDEHDFFNVYFTKGLNVEGEVVAKHLQQAGEATGKVLQVFRQGNNAAQQAALSLSEEGEEHKLNLIRNHQIARRQSISANYWKQLLKKEQPDTLVLWLDASDLKELSAIADYSPAIKRLYLSATLLETINPKLPEKIQSISYLTHRYLVPGTPAYQQIETFMRSHAEMDKLNTGQRWLAGDTVWSLSLLSEAIRQMKYNSRELLVETVEMLVSLKPSVFYPRLGLAADQRFASKGCFVVPFNKPKQAEWLVPD